MFWKRKQKPFQQPESKPLEPKPRDIGKEIEDIKLTLAFRVSRFDQDRVYLDALIQLHPEVEVNPEVVDFYRRVEDYKKAKELEERLGQAGGNNGS